MLLGTVKRTAGHQTDSFFGPNIMYNILKASRWQVDRSGGCGEIFSFGFRFQPSTSEEGYMTKEDAATELYQGLAIAHALCDMICLSV